MWVATLLEELAPCGRPEDPGHVYVLAARTGRGLDTKGHILVSITTPLFFGCNGTFSSSEAGFEVETKRGRLGSLECMAKEGELT
jgi:hypothetical protein